MKMRMQMEMTDRSEQVRAELEAAIGRALEGCGQTAVALARARCPVDTGRLRASVVYRVTDARAVTVGSTVAYAPRVELGGVPNVGLGPGGGPGPGEKGRAAGQAARAFIRPALAEHGRVYRGVMKRELEGR